MTATLPGRARLGLGWVTWRQQRGTLLALGGLAGSLSAVMLAAGLRGHAIYPAFVHNHCAPVTRLGVTLVPT